MSDVSWKNRPLFTNRPPYINAPIQIYAGFRGTWGTESIPVGNFKLQELNASTNDISIEIKATDSWAYYGDRIAGTWNGTGFIKDILENCLKYNGFDYKDYILNTITSDFFKIPVLNRQNNPISINTGGFGVNLFSYITPISSGDQPAYNSFNADTYGSYFIENEYLKTQNHIFIKQLNFVGTFGTYWGGGVGRRYEGENFKYCIGNNLITNKCIGAKIRDVREIGSYSFAGMGSFYMKGKGTQYFQLVSINKSGWTENYIKNISFPNGSITDLAYDSISQCGYLIEGTSKRIMRYGTDGIINGTFTIGTQDSVFNFTTYLEPVANMTGTKTPILLFEGLEGTNNYIYKYSGTGSFTFMKKNIIKIDVINNKLGTFTSGAGIGVARENGIPFVYSAGYRSNTDIYYDVADIVSHAYGTLKEAFLSIYKVGQFGFDFQHSYIKNGSVYVNNVDFIGSWKMANAGSSTFVVDNMLSNTDVVTASYGIDTIPLNINCGTWKFKDLTEKLSNLSLGCCYFDTLGRFVYTDKRKTIQNISIYDDVSRSYGSYLIETCIAGNIDRNIAKVKNVVTVVGTSSVGTSIYIDQKSQNMYGTRILTPYQSDFLTILADVNVYGTMLLNYLKDIKTEVNTEIPFHPEIELLDGFSYNDSVNTSAVSTIIVKKISNDLKDFKTNISGETR